MDWQIVAGEGSPGSQQDASRDYSMRRRVTQHLDCGHVSVGLQAIDDHCAGLDVLAPPAFQLAENPITKLRHADSARVPVGAVDRSTAAAPTGRPEGAPQGFGDLLLSGDTELANSPAATAGVNLHVEQVAWSTHGDHPRPGGSHQPVTGARDSSSQEGGSP